MAGPWDPIDSSQPPRPAQPAQRTTPAATALGGTTGSQPAQAPRAPQAAAGAGAPAGRQGPPPGEWDVVSTEAAPPAPREVGFVESAARTFGASATPVVRTIGLAGAGLLEQVKGVAQLADTLAPIFGLQSDMARQVQDAQDRVFAANDQMAASMRDVYNPKAGEEFSTPGAVAGGVLGMANEVVGGFGAQRGIERAADVTQRGGSGTEAAKAGVVSGVANVAANLLPVKAGGTVGRVLEKGLAKVLPGGAAAGAVAGGAVSGGALGAGADIGVAAAENAALPEGEAFQDLQREADPAVSGGLGSALGATAAALATRGKGRAPKGTKPAEKAEGGVNITTKPVSGFYTPEAITSFAEQRIRDLESKGKETPERTITGPDGEKVKIPAKRAEFISPSDRAELEFLRKAAGDVDRIADGYGIGVERSAKPAAEVPRGAAASPGSVGAAGTDIETQRRERARSLPVGIELTKGQASRDFEQTQFERETAKDGKTGAKLRETFAEQNDRVRANLDALFELTGAEMPDVRGAGKRVVDAVAKRAAEVKAEVDAEYQRAREAGEMAEEVDTTALVTKLRDIEPSATNAGVIKTAQAELIRLGGAERAEDGSLVPGKLSVDALEELRKTVGVGGRKDDTNAHFAREIKSAIDMATAKAGGDIYRSARAKYRAYAEEFKNRKIVADLITTKRGTDERRVALEDVHKRTIKDGSVDEITKLRDTLRGAGLDGQQAWRELQGQTIAEIRDAALKNTARNERGAKVVSHAGMNRVVQTLDKDGKLDLVFGKKGAELLRDLNDLAADVYTAPPGSVNFSNTASALRNLFDNLVTYGVSGLPVPAREVMGQIGRMLRSRGLRKRVDEAVPASQPARGGDIKPGVFEPPATPPAAPPAPRGGGPSGPSAPPGQGNLFPPTTGAAAPAPRKQLLGRAPDIKKLPVPEVIEDSAPRIPVPEVIEDAAPVPAGAARELTGAELDAPELADWLKAHRFGNEAGADALRVDKALQIDPEAVQRAATQHARQPGSFIRAVDGIIEKGQKDATDTGSAARGGEGLPREGGSEAGNRQGEGAAPGAQDGAGSAQADGAAQVAPDASAAETARMNREAVETHVAAAMREFEKATAPTGNPITDRLADKLRSDYSRAVEEYDRLPDTNGGRILNTDIARELSADYLQNRTRAADVHEPASAFIKRRYAEKLAGPTPEGLDRRVLFTAGGAGAGKSSVVRELLTDEAGQSEITYDTNMDGLGSSILKIEQALNAGREVSIAYVYAKPEDAFQQAMKRTMNQKKEHGTGRTVPIQVFIDTHIGVSKTIRNLADRYRHDLRVEFSFLDNSRGYKNAAAVPLRDLPVVADNGLREKLEAAAQEAFREGRIDADTLAGFLAAPQHAPRAPRVGAADGGRPEPGGGEGSPDALSARPALAGPSGSQTSVVTERGMRVPVRYRLVELDDLITSHTNDLTVNPAFPAELQPRDRTRASSQAQIARIANDIQPDLMAESPKASDGAPIIGPDGLVESGNARTIALRRAYGMGKADHYKAYLAENADRFGLTPEQVAGFKQPALVRERTTDVGRAEFARQANEAAVAAMSDAEQARSDAGLLPDLEKLETNDDGSLNIYRSNEFIREFMLAVASPAERGRLMTADGSLSQTGVNRIRNAVFAKAYDDPDLVAKLSEDTDGNTKNVMSGMLRAAPAVAKLRELSAAGARNESSFIADIADAARRFSEARRDGQKVEDYLKKRSLIGGDATPRVETFMYQLEVDSRAPRRIAEWIDGLVREVDSAGDPRQSSLLGEPRGQYNVGSLADDLGRQKAYLDAEAKKAGHTDVDAFAAADMDGFLRAAAAWREANPAGELREPGGDAYLTKLHSAAGELAGQIQQEARLQDFAPTELPQVLRQWADDAKVDAADLRQLLLRRIDQSDMTDGRKRQVRAALDPTRPSNLLTPPTPEGLRQADARRQAAEAADKAEQQRLADKARADAMVDGFTLTGSNSAADQAAAAGQASLFEPSAAYRARVTETPAFRAWFGDSKIVDADGKPRVVYHGTRDFMRTGKAIDEFAHTYSRGAGALGKGFYFTASGPHASGYAERGAGGYIVPAYLQVSNPIKESDLIAALDKDGRARGIADDDYEKAIAPFARELGHDGILGDDGVTVVVFKPEQIKSAIGNRGTFSPEEASIIREERGAYAVDLFGDPVDNPPPAPRRGALRPVRRELPTDTEAPAGDYGARTIVNRETKRKLGATSIKSMADLAAATRYLYKSAVERIDGIVTDKSGKPLAVVGGFKGALAEARTYPAVMMAEALRVPGAAQLWLSHNHPSGTPDLSRGDEAVLQQTRAVFDGSGIEVKAIVAVAGDKFGGAEHTSRGLTMSNSAAIPATGVDVDVPVIERELVPQPDPQPQAISSPAEAKDAALRYYQHSGNKPGLVLMDWQHRPTAWVPIPTSTEGKLKGTGGLRALYRAISESNAGAALLVHGGELAKAPAAHGKLTAPYGSTVATNIAAALRSIDVRVLDIVDVKTRKSQAESFTLTDSKTFWSVGALTAAGAVGALAGSGGDAEDES